MMSIYFVDFKLNLDGKMVLLDLNGDFHYTYFTNIFEKSKLMRKLLITYHSQMPYLEFNF